MLSKYNFILWDFDGVIIDSNPARVLGFERVLKNYPSDQVNELLEYHRKNGGLSRYVKLRYFFEKIRQEQVSEERILEMANQFSVLMKEILTGPNLLIQDSVSFIKENASKVPMHIVSGSDGTELRYLCNQLGIADYFKSISGSPTPKTELVKQLIDSGEIVGYESCFIGDAGNDYDAANANGIDFYGYNNLDLKGIGKGYIDHFRQ
jgi:phosphoglycolate phosphatase-like HAD superfamily hydrolase